ncbi:hypothetical protein EYC84_008893 [Monilinia fructicola]|uniref:Uncharacterized protein n=1 Tax=Monilinia fructicola TaxID=38448 RepID=A0A5M9JCH7_MONFR|nr:hypothetical protein EYC84_008893 [Monilinia fructicola]
MGRGTRHYDYWSVSGCEHRDWCSSLELRGWDGDLSGWMMFVECIQWLYGNASEGRYLSIHVFFRSAFQNSLGNKPL